MTSRNSWCGSAGSRRAAASRRRPGLAAGARAGRAGPRAGRPALIAPISGSSDGLLAGVQAFFQQPINIVSIMFALMVGRMAAYVGDQIMVQRLQTTKSLKDARQAVA